MRFIDEPRSIDEIAAAEKIAPNEEVLRGMWGKFYGCNPTLLKDGSKLNERKNIIRHEGAGYFWIDNVNESREWAGYFDHMLSLARIGSHFGKELQERGHEEIDPSRILNLLLMIHYGKRPWKEANTYKESRDQYPAMPANDAEMAGMVVEKFGVPEDLKLMLANWTHQRRIPGREDLSLELEIGRYSSLRYRNEKVRSLAGHLASYAMKYVLPEKQEDTRLLACLEWGFRDILEVLEKAAPIEVVKATVQTGMTMIKKRFPDTFNDDLFQQYSMDYVLEGYLYALKTEKSLKEQGIDPDSVTGHHPQMPEWEMELRRKYLESVKVPALKRIIELKSPLAQTDLAQFEKEFPPRNWWGKALQTGEIHKDISWLRQEEAELIRNLLK